MRSLTSTNSRPYRYFGGVALHNCALRIITGKLNKLTLTIDRPKLTPEDEKRLMEAERNNKMSE